MERQLSFPLLFIILKVLLGFGPTLKRELAEGLGWAKADIKNIIDVWSFCVETDRVHKQFVVLVYYCTGGGEKIIKNGEYAEYGWIPVEEIKNINIREGYKKTIEKFLGEEYK